MAVLGTGLGMPRNQVELVKQVPRFWDTTVWAAVERPFLDEQAHAYANALCAWTRNEKNPVWSSNIATQLKKPMHRSFKYLQKTSDCYVTTESSAALLDQSETEWLQTAAGPGITQQIIAIRHFQPHEHLTTEHEETLLQKTRSSNRFLVLHAIAALEFLQLDTESVKNELTLLTDSADEEIRSKAMIGLSRLEAINEFAHEQALKMLGSRNNHVVFAAMVGLLSHESIDVGSLKTVDRGFLQALQTCDYEFVGLFASAYNKWLDDPKQHVKTLLADGQPEYLQIAIDAVSNAEKQTVPAE